MLEHSDPQSLYDPADLLAVNKINVCPCRLMEVFGLLLRLMQNLSIRRPAFWYNSIYLSAS